MKGNPLGKPAPTPPTPVDPTAVAGAQTTSNLATAQAQAALNNTNQSTPYGSVAYTQPGGPDTAFTETTTLSPQEQAIFNASTANQAGALNLATGDLGNVASALATPVNAPGLQGSYSAGGPVATGYGTGGAIQGQIGTQDVNQSVQSAEQANFAQQMQLMQPQMQQAQESNQAQLVAQGLNPNDAAYGNEMTQFNNGQAVQYDQAADNAVAAGNAEQNTLFGQQATQGQFANAAQSQANTQNQAQAGFQNTAQAQTNSENAAAMAAANQAANQSFQNQVTAQQLPINEFTALESNSQVQAPSSTPAQTAVAPTDVLGAYSLQAQQQQAQYAAQQAQYNSGLSGLFSLGSAALTGAGNAGGLGALLAL
jgi:hypothetical protein